MISIYQPTKQDSKLVSDLSQVSFIESHGSSASVSVIDEYVEKKLNEPAIKEELSDPKNIYHIISYNEQPVGFSKIILNCEHAGIELENVTKLGKLYLLKEFYDLKLGFDLLQFNIEISKRFNQAGMWLFVWKENHRATRFYEKNGFKVIGSYDFQLSASHSNPNYHMLLQY